MTILSIPAAFLMFVPLVTYVLLVMKGLPSFAVSHVADVLLWCYQATWPAALGAGVLVALAVKTLTRRTAWFHRPYDFGRCFSLGAVSGALAEALSTWLYREISHRPFSSFWIAGAVMAGCLVGGPTVAYVLWRMGGAEQGSSLTRHPRGL